MHTHTQRETHTHTSQWNRSYFSPQVTFPFTEISTDLFLLNTQDSPLLACSLGKTGKDDWKQKVAEEPENSHSCLQFLNALLLPSFSTYLPELLVKKIIHCLPIVGTNESWLWLWDAGSLPGREGDGRMPSGVSHYPLSFLLSSEEKGIRKEFTDNSTK